MSLCTFFLFLTLDSAIIINQSNFLSCFYRCNLLKDSNLNKISSIKMMLVRKRPREEIDDFTLCRLVQPKTGDKGTLQINDKLLERYLEETVSQRSVIRTCNVAPNKAIVGGTLLQRFKILEEKQHRRSFLSILLTNAD